MVLEKKEEKMKVNVLGSEYTVEFKKLDEDSLLKTRDGYCEHSVRKIVVCEFEREENSIEDLEKYKNDVLRHELVHAFLIESGLQTQSWADNEEMVDWIALQFPKMMKVFQESECL